MKHWISQFFVMVIFRLLLILLLLFSGVFKVEANLENSKLLIAERYQETESLNRQLAENAIELRKFKRVSRALTVASVVFFALALFLVIIQLQNRKRLRSEKTRTNVLKKRMDDEIIYAGQLEEIIKELEKLSLVTRKSENAIVIFNESGEIEWVNDGFTELYGYSYEEFIQERGINIVKASYNPSIREEIKACVESLKPMVYTMQVKNKFGKKIWVQTTLSPILNESGKLQKLIAIDADITKVKETEEKLSLYRQEIIDSLHYARTIQDAVLPKKEKIAKFFPDHFVFYSPQQIVGGDFYWMHNIYEKTFIAVADYTGHGVPGAFMSLIGYNLLNHIIIELGVSDTAEVLKILNREIVKILDSDRPDSQNLDGMDISLICFDYDDQILTFSAAYQILYFIQKGNIIEVKGERIPVGNADEKKAKFKKHIYEVENGDSIYLFTDGFADQFGGEQDKKFLTYRFRDLITEIHTQDMPGQGIAIKESFENWKGNNEQIDDVLVLGLRFTC